MNSIKNVLKMIFPNFLRLSSHICREASMKFLCVKREGETSNDLGCLMNRICWIESSEAFRSFSLPLVMTTEKKKKKTSNKNKIGNIFEPFKKDLHCKNIWHISYHLFIRLFLILFFSRKTNNYFFLMGQFQSNTILDFFPKALSLFIC